jgi:hypothetical protein
LLKHLKGEMVEVLPLGMVDEGEDALVDWFQIGWHRSSHWRTLVFKKDRSDYRRK